MGGALEDADKQAEDLRQHMKKISDEDKKKREEQKQKEQQKDDDHLIL